jgi:alpha-beta hydrolase superfamily lysophospholipase
VAGLHVVSRSPASPTRPHPILFVHGAFHSSWVWEEHFLPYFAARGYEVHAVNWRGHGRSGGHETLHRNRIADYVADVAQAASALKEPPILVGHSMGGFVVQKCLEGFRAPAGILLASAPPGGTRQRTVKTALHHPGKLLKALLTGRVNLYNTEAGAYQAFFSATMPREQVRRYVSHLQDESLRAFMDMARFPVQTEKVKAPMLVLGAAHDFFIDSHELEQTARAYATTPEIFPDMAHDMMVEPGWNRVADRMIEWLTTLGL